LQNLIKCPNCSKILIGEEYEDHTTRCISKVKEIPVTYIVKIDKPDKRIYLARGVDGILYRLVKVLSDDFLQRDKKGRNPTETGQNLITQKQRLHLIEQVNNICEKCSMYFETKLLEIHHIDNDPSNSDFENLMVVCANCHKLLRE
jgi:hypothetical protein